MAHELCMPARLYKHTETEENHGLVLLFNQLYRNFELIDKLTLENLSDCVVYGREDLLVSENACRASL